MHILFPALSLPRLIASYLLKKGYRVSPFSPSLFSSDMPEPPNVPLYYRPKYNGEFFYYLGKECPHTFRAELE